VFRHVVDITAPGIEADIAHPRSVRRLTYIALAHQALFAQMDTPETSG
jgi:hypothetical protein